uniref:RING-type domain-containing protein n=1 Tax=Amphora coffeiformis TaxID=265554 RepID=A0A7S3LFV5_9STRA|eukprot:scaffold20209_cov182-Amphora_coffeaeformis.AAC.3
METDHSVFNDSGKDSADGDDQQSFLNENYKVLAVTMVMLSSILAVVSCWLREVCYDKCGIEFCSGSVSTARRREIRRNHIRAMHLQRQMERDLQESSLAKQEERKQICGEFLQKLSKVRRMITGFSTLNGLLSNKMNMPIMTKFLPQVLTEADIAVEEVEETNATVEPTRNLKFCPHDPCKEHVLEAVCIICFRDYEVGEQVVWSSSETCRHVYHMECMLKWLSTGKKKCPICRSWFVPGTCFDGKEREQNPGATTNLGNSDQPHQGSDPVSTEPGQGLDSV